MGERRELHRLVLDCVSVVVELICDDPLALSFVAEFFDPWFRPTRRDPERSVRITATESTWRDIRQRVSPEAPALPCFAHDREVLSLPACRSGHLVHVLDAERSCALTIQPGRIDLIADPRTRRWRFTLLWVLQEISATRLRRTHIDLHSAAVESAGRGLLIAGPKGAGKTTLSFHLMQSHQCGSIANDRSFIGGNLPAILGMPTAVKIRPPTLAAYPALRAGLPPVARPYLYTATELGTAEPSTEPIASVDFALTPNQITQRLGSRSVAAAPLGAIVFPEVRDDVPAWTVEPLSEAELIQAIGTNLYGAANGDRPQTLFEELDGGHRRPSPQLVAAIATAVPGYRVRLGRAAYADGTLGQRLLELVAE